MKNITKIITICLFFCLLKTQAQQNAIENVVATLQKNSFTIKYDLKSAEPLHRNNIPVPYSTDNWATKDTASNAIDDINFVTQNTGLAIHWAPLLRTNQSDSLVATQFQFEFVANLFNNVRVLPSVTVQGGTFVMGCQSSRDDLGSQFCRTKEIPAHNVTLSTFSITPYEITNAEYATFLNAMTNSITISGNYVMGGYDTTIFGSNTLVGSYRWININTITQPIAYSNGTFTVDIGYENYAVNNVSWYGAKAFANWAGGTLPSEAQWEFAARGGNCSQGYMFSGSNNIDDVAWYTGNSNGRTRIVGEKQPNELGLYDMSGNLWEWCLDNYSSTAYSSHAHTLVNPVYIAFSSYKIIRGGDWNNSATAGRVASRYYDVSTNGYRSHGFRIVFF